MQLKSNSMGGLRGKLEASTEEPLNQIRGFCVAMPRGHLDSRVSLGQL